MRKCRRGLYHLQRGSMLIKLQPLCSEEDQILLHNPDRGFYFEVEYDVAKDSTMYTEDQSGPSGDLERKCKLYAEDFPKLVKLYIHLNGYRGRDIDETGISRIRALFECVRRAGLKCILSFVYQYDINGIEVNGERKFVGSQGDGQTDAQTVFRHIRQLKPLLYENRTLISIVQMGFIGAWGEWSLYDTEEYPSSVRRQIIEAVADMTPPEVYLALRQPIYKKLLVDRKSKLYRRIGFHCDAIFGTLDANDWGSTGWDKGKEQWDMAIREAKSVPVLGELFWGWWFKNHSMTLEGKDVLEQLTAHRYYSFNIGHSYKENGGEDKEFWPLYQWKSESVTEEFLKSKKYPYTEAWFRDSNGLKKERTVYEYIRDFLGYRFSIKAIKAERVTGGINLSFVLRNDGFSSPWNLKGRLVVCNAQKEQIEELLCFDAEKIRRQKYIHAFLPEKFCFQGAMLALAIENLAGQPVRIANRVPFEKGKNILIQNVNLL